LDSYLVPSASMGLTGESESSLRDTDRIDWTYCCYRYAHYYLSNDVLEEENPARDTKGPPLPILRLCDVSY